MNYVFILLLPKILWAEVARGPKLVLLRESSKVSLYFEPKNEPYHKKKTKVTAQNMPYQLIESLFGKVTANEGF